MRTLLDKSMSLPPGPLGGIAWLRRLDRRAALVCSRSQRLFEERVGDLIDLARRIDDEQIDRADIAAGSDGWTDRENRAAHDVTPPFGDEDGRMGQEDELPKQIGRFGLSGGAGAQPIAAQGDETIDVRDPGRSDPVVQLVCSLEVRAGADSIRPAPTGADRAPVLADRTGGSV